MYGFSLRTIILFALCVLSHHIVNAQLNGYQLRITEEDGLSDNNIECIYKDHNGFFWVGTASGLNLIDGSQITVFKNIPGDKTSISNNHILSINEDYDGKIWVGTAQGLNCFDPLKRKFISLPDQLNGISKTEQIFSIARDKADQLFIATGNGLIHYNPGTKKGQRINIPGVKGNKQRNNQISHLVFDRNGLLYFTNYSGLWSYDVQSNRFTHEINRPALFTYCIFDHEGNLWIGTWDEGLIKWDPLKKTETIYNPGNRNQSILAITEMPVAPGYPIITNSFVLNHTPSKTGVSPIPKSAFGDIRTILFNPEDDRLWVGSNQGIFLIRESLPDFTYHDFGHTITSQNVSVVESGSQYLVGGSGNDFLKLFGKNLKEVKNFSSLIPYKDVVCLDIEPDGQHRIRCGTTNGFADIDLATGAVAFHHLEDAAANQRQLNFINSIFKDSENNWWIFPWRNGIWELKANTTTPKKVFNNFLTQFDQPKPLVISDACEDRHGNIWLSDYDEGIILYNRNTHTFSKPFADSLGQYYACSQIIYHNGYCYSFLSTTLLIWNTDSMKLHKVPLLPLRDKTINSIALDSNGHVWMATQNGLIAYNIKEKTLLHFTKADGLTSNQLNGYLYCAHDGSIVFGGLQYLFSYRPESLLKHTQGSPQIKLSEVIVDGEPFKFQSTGNHSFDHTKSNFIFKWAVTDYTDPLNNHYYYQLEGIDKKWRNAGTRGEAEFANLSPGQYTLLLKGENSNGIVANKILKLQFVILPPFWNTWWFITFLFLLIAAFFYALYRYRLSQLMRVEKLRDNISINLHDDIGSTLSSISILSEMALHRNTDLESEKMLGEIKENSMVMMDRMDDIVWSINPKNDSLENLFVRIRAFAGRLFEAKDIEYSITIDENIHHVLLNMEYRQHIYLIMKEAINNIVRHAECTEAAIIVTYNAPLLSITISDNGIGIRNTSSSGGNGLYSMKKRASEIKGTLDIQTHTGKGTSIVLLAKIK